MRIRRRRTFDRYGRELHTPSPMYVNGKQLKSYFVAGDHRVVMTLTDEAGRVEQYPGKTFEEARTLLENAQGGPRRKRQDVKKHVERAKLSERIVLNGNYVDTGFMQKIAEVNGETPGA